MVVRTRQSVTKQNPIYSSKLKNKANRRNDKALYKGLYSTKVNFNNPPAAVIRKVDKNNPLIEVSLSLRDHGAIISMTLSPDGKLLATLSTIGQAKLWRVPTVMTGSWDLVGILKDNTEMAIEEFYCGAWLVEGPTNDDYDDDGQIFFAAAGKRKDRHRWSDTDDDNYILPGIIKIFNGNGQVVHRLEGHEEEILYLKTVEYKGSNLLLSCSQDGYIIVWRFSKDWKKLQSKLFLKDGITCMAFSIEPIPGSENRLLLAACDDKLRIFDLERMTLNQTFDTGYSSYCDHLLFVDPLYLDPSIYKMDSGREWFVLIRGVELLDTKTLLPMAPNSIKLFKMTLLEDESSFQMDLVFSLSADLNIYSANSWLMKLAISGSLVIAPTVTGQVLCFDLNHVKTSSSLSEILTARLHHHDPLEVRQALFHPTLPFLFTCADDGKVKIYFQPTV